MCVLNNKRERLVVMSLGINKDREWELGFREILDIGGSERERERD